MGLWFSSECESGELLHLQISFQQASELERDGVGWGWGVGGKQMHEQQQEKVSTVYVLCVWCESCRQMAVWVYSQFYMVGGCVGLQPISYA